MLYYRQTYQHTTKSPYYHNNPFSLLYLDGIADSTRTSRYPESKVLDSALLQLDLHNNNNWPSYILEFQLCSFLDSCNYNESFVVDNSIRHNLEL